MRDLSGYPSWEQTTVPILLSPKATIVIRPFEEGCGFAIETEDGRVIASLSGIDYSFAQFSLQPMAEGGGTMFQVFWKENG
jgi:hypothetical protein